jgi:hypothetical protein
MAFFFTEKRKNAVFTILHFQSLVAIEDGGTSVCRAGASIFRGALDSRSFLEKTSAASTPPSSLQGRIHGVIRKK